MSLPTLHSSVISHPSTVFLSAAAVIGLFTLNASPAFIPVILLLATLRLFVSTVLSKTGARSKISLSSIVVAASATVANIAPSASALAHTHASTAVVSLFALGILISSVVLGVLYLEGHYRQCSSSTWSQTLLLPTLWATTLFLISTISPLGRLATWSPVSGLNSYTWLRPVFGSSGIDWLVGSWAVVVSEMCGIWLADLSRKMDEEVPRLIDYDTARRGQSINIKRSRGLMYLIGILIMLTIPSFLMPSLPLPLESQNTVPLSVACALPKGTDNAPPSFDQFLHETQTLESFAKVILWPEGAVRFETEQAKQEAIERVTLRAQSAVVGVSFEDAVTSNDTDSRRSGLRRNGIMFIDKDGVALEYYKRNLVPFVESYSMVASRNSPEVYDYALIMKRNAHGKVSETLPVPMTTSICLDFASNAPFSSLKERPALILGPARTWHESIGAAMWAQAKARADELGSALLWCDGGENGVSGAIGHMQSMGEVVQVGPGSWATSLALEIPLVTSRTPYGRANEWLPMIAMWCLFGLKWAIDGTFSSLKRVDSNSPFSRKWLILSTHVGEFLAALRRKTGVRNENQSNGEQPNLL